MTESDNPSLQTSHERETNQQLQFDTDWETIQPGQNNSMAMVATASSAPPAACSSSCHDKCLKFDWESSTSTCVCPNYVFCFFCSSFITQNYSFCVFIMCMSKFV